MKIASNLDNQFLTELDKLTDEQVLQESEDLPQEVTEPYGTGVHDQPGFSVGDRFS